jgi:hypothetical protein
LRFPHVGWLRAEIGTDSPAERLEPACGRLAGEHDVVDLPDRLAVFGLTRLPTAYLDVLTALAVQRDVHLYLLHPSAALWAKTPEEATNPLFRSWGRDAHDRMQLVVVRRDTEAVDDVMRRDRLRRRLSCFVTPIASPTRSRC